ncbi:PTS sugar transporter subunit IIA [Psychromonas sp. SA13A]|uniref:PTS sugar transporter subunit IIA n=1 Tax=Psychromonas sp. SA13A TaxID=2686346 RepID=UPI00140D1AD7|nr:PTS sugar transporter subunit IIA [Psychromonas sp. SA13A]
MIILKVKCEDAKEAISIAGQLLVDNGFCNENYKNKMLDFFDEFGSYIVVDEHIAMPHARPEDGALKSGFSVVTLDPPINFGNEDNDPVSIVFGLVGTNSDEHINTITKLADLCNSPNFVKSLINCNNLEEAKALLT